MRQNSLSFFLRASLRFIVHREWKERLSRTTVGLKGAFRNALLAVLDKKRGENGSRVTCLGGGLDTWDFLAASLNPYTKKLENWGVSEQGIKIVNDLTELMTETYLFSYIRNHSQVAKKTNKKVAQCNIVQSKD